MASSPPFLVEDQTDEDFFDKLVKDDDDDVFNVPSKTSSVPIVADGSDSDEAKAFANLSIGDESEAIEEDVKTALPDAHEEGKSSSLVPLNSVGSDNVIESNNEVVGKEVVSNLTATKSSMNSDNAAESNNGTIGADLTATKSGMNSDNVIGSNNGTIGADLTTSTSTGSGGSGVKEVQWSAFNSDSLPNGGNGFGSYGDIFGEFGDDGNFGENFNTESNVVSAGEEHKPAHVDHAHNYSQYQEGQVYGNEQEPSAGGQDMNSSQYWENLYPGWKYDQNTGQWYQVDGYDPSTNVQGNFDSAVRDEKSEISYLQQTSQSAVGTIPQSGTTESVTNWSSQGVDATETGPSWNQATQATDNADSVWNWDQVSQENNGYPSHMIFDPQYPGWYYDTIFQEWRSLDTYVSSSQSTVQAENHLGQSGFASTGISHENDQKTQGAYGQFDTYESGGVINKEQNYNGARSFGNYNQQGSNLWQPDSDGQTLASSGFSGNQQLEDQDGETFSVGNHVGQQKSYDYGENVSYNDKPSQGVNDFSTISGHQGFVPGGNFSQQFNQPQIDQNKHMHASSEYYGKQNVVNYQSGHQFSYATAAGRSSAGRPPHSLVCFGFGGKLIMMKDNSLLSNSSFGSQDAIGGSLSVLNLMEVVNDGPGVSSTRSGVGDYFHTLCRQSFPGPLATGNAGVKELNKWADERIAHCKSPDMDYREGEVLRLLLSLLKIALQHYGKLRSPFGTDTALKENDAPESAVARLFASAKRNDSRTSEYGNLAHCLQRLPSEGQIRATAAEVQTLLVSGRKREALHCAQEGQLWGPALVLAGQLGNQFYIDTLNQMALRQLVPGTPLRTLCLLIAGQPAEVFSADTAAENASQPPAQLGANGMLDDWEENLAVITANRTKDDELVLIHLGDCLWKERTEIIAAHICYLVAEANFEPYSDSARLCLIGSDHFRFPRTYASPEAIQRTEIYEYAKLLGNSQFILLPFQPYKLVYAHMLAEVGRISDSLKYCQAVSKSLKTGRAPEVETWRQLSSSLEERIKTHQQGGFSTNLAPAKLVGKLLNLFDSTAHRVVGGLPPPAPSTTVGNIQGNENYSQSSSGFRVSTSQSTMAMSSLIPSASTEPADGNMRTMHNRSVSEPDFGRTTPKQGQNDSSKEATSANAQNKASVSGGTSRFGRFGFGSQFLQKILKPRQDKQAKLGETNKFYYDEKLKRWVEEGVDLPAEEAALPPPPTAAAFPNGTSDYNWNSTSKSGGLLSNGSLEYQSPPSLGHNSGIPPIPPTSNQFSARGRVGVRSRYVDTFNQGGGNPTNLFQAPSVPSIKPTNSNVNPKFFVPTAAPQSSSNQPMNDTTAPQSSSDQPMNNTTADGAQQTTSGNENPAVSSTNNSFQSFAPPSSSSMNMQRFASMDNISSGSHSSHSRRTASWSGGLAGSFSPLSRAEMKPLGEVLGMPPSPFMPNNPGLTHSSGNGSSYRDDLHEVEL